MFINIFFFSFCMLLRGLCHLFLELFLNARKSSKRGDLICRIALNRQKEPEGSEDLETDYDFKKIENAGPLPFKLCSDFSGIS